MSNAGIALLWSESRRKAKQNDQTKNDQTRTIPISNFIKRVLDHKIDIGEFHKTY